MTFSKPGWEPGSTSGSMKYSSAHISLRLFWMGVPVCEKHKHARIA